MENSVIQKTRPDHFVNPIEIYILINAGRLPDFYFKIEIEVLNIALHIFNWRQNERIKHKKWLMWKIKISSQTISIKCVKKIFFIFST